MTKPTPIGRKRFKVAKRLVEPSKYAVMKENEELRAKAVCMTQLLAAVMMEIPENVEELQYKTDDLECINPAMVQVEIKDGICILRLVAPPDPDPDPGESKVA